jgi:predicted porin
MHNNKIAITRFLPLTLATAVALATAQQAAAEIVLYDKDDTTFSTDGYINAFYVNSDVDRDGEKFDRRQSRVKMGFLPNWIGFNFGKQIDDLKLTGRSSFWVTINDSETNGTDTAIDVRQFYGTVSSPEWGEVLVGKDFGLFSRSNIFLDELLAGYGNVSDTLGLVDGTGVSFGNIGTGYPYPFPTSQITYRNNNLAEGLRVAVGIMDPGRHQRRQRHRQGLSGKPALRIGSQLPVRGGRLDHLHLGQRCLPDLGKHRRYGRQGHLQGPRLWRAGQVRAACR